MTVVESTPLLLTKLSMEPEESSATDVTPIIQEDFDISCVDQPSEISKWQKCFNCCARLRSTVTIEPAVFVYFLGFASLRFTAQQFVYNQYLIDWTIKYGTSDAFLNDTTDESACEDISAVQEVTAQETTATFLMIYDTLCLLPGVLFVAFAGSLSDRYGRKKAVLCPCLGVTLRAISCFLVGVININVNFLYIGALIDGFMGGQCMFVATAYACVADVSGKEHRSLRFYVIQAVNGVGLVVGQLSIGYLIFYTGFVYPFLIITVILALNIPIIMFYMNESVAHDKNKPVQTIKQQIANSAKLVIDGPDRMEGIERKYIVRLLIIIVLLMGISTEGLISPLTLYLLRSPRCFSSVELAYFLVLLMVAGGLASLFVVGYVNKFLSDYGILTLGMISALLGKVWLICPFNNPYIGPYGCAMISCFGSLPNSMVRSALSKLANHDQQGAMSSCVTIAQQLGVTLGGFFLGFLYSVTVATYSESIFCIAAGLNVIAIGFICYIFYLRNQIHDPRPQKFSEADSIATVTSLEPSTQDR